jgi:hypothetical protein
MTPEQIEHFLNWCWLEDPDFDEIEEGRLRSVIKDTGGLGLCNYVTDEFVLFAKRYMNKKAYTNHISGPNTHYPEMTEKDGHWFPSIDGVVYDFTARQFNENYPVPYIWKLDL